MSIKGGNVMLKYLEETYLLDYSHNKIQDLIRQNNWFSMSEYDKILNAYNFVRDSIEFGYNIDDNIPASQILSDGYGQCNTKGILFMALLRSLNVPCRMHGFLIDKTMQKGAMKGIYYSLAPKEIVHIWVEIFYNNQWLNLEGFILDIKYLNNLQNKFSECIGSFCGYGVATKTFQKPPIDWNNNSTYIQSEGITKDLGIFDSPDHFFTKHHQDLNFIKKFFYQKIVRYLMNKNIKKIRHH